GFVSSLTAFDKAVFFMPSEKVFNTFSDGIVFFKQFRSVRHCTNPIFHQENGATSCTLHL
ncbi:hypothetical protein, partial [Gallibacterium anatis]